MTAARKALPFEKIIVDTLAVGSMNFYTGAYATVAYKQGSYAVLFPYDYEGELSILRPQAHTERNVQAIRIRTGELIQLQSYNFEVVTSMGSILHDSFNEVVAMELHPTGMLREVGKWGLEREFRSDRGGGSYWCDKKVLDAYGKCEEALSPYTFSLVSVHNRLAHVGRYALRLSTNLQVPELLIMLNRIDKYQ